MQQAYQALRVVSEAQTVYIVLAAQPGELILEELSAACAGLQDKSSSGIKAVVLDFDQQPEAQNATRSIAPDLLTHACESVRAIPQPALAIARASLSDTACWLYKEADFTLVAHEAELCLPGRDERDGWTDGDKRVGGLAAVRLGYATWTAPASDLNREMERILGMLRTKSAVALRNAKTSVRLAQQYAAAPQEALRRVNQFYLENVMQTEDAREGLKAFLEKRQPRWSNR